MEDKQIVELFWARSEDAISECSGKYGAYCYSIAHNILRDHSDSEECVNDTYMNAWNAIPPACPDRLGAFLGKITRNLALNRWEKSGAQKRGAGRIPLALEELRDCVPTADVSDVVDDILLAELMERFLASLNAERRRIFIRRYWYFNSVAEIAVDLSMSESKVKMSLLRTRRALRQLLEKEGIAL